MSSTFQFLLNENSIFTDSVTTNNLIITGTIDLSEAKLTGFPVDNKTIEVDNQVLKVKYFGINTPHLANLAIISSKINDEAVTTSKIADLGVTDKKINSIASTKVIETINNNINNEIIMTENLSVSGDVDVVGDIKGDTINTKKLVVTDVIDITGSEIYGFPIDDVTLNLDSGLLEVKDGGINTMQLANGSVTSEKLDDGVITVNKLEDESVTTNKLAKFSVTTDRLDYNSVDSVNYVANSIFNYHIRDKTITGDKIADLAIGWDHIINESIDSWKIKNDCIAWGHLTYSCVHTDNI